MQRFPAQQSPAQAPEFSRPEAQPDSLQEILIAHDESAATVRHELAKLSDAAMQEMLRVNQGDRELFAAPRAKIVRDIMLNHWYQHRGQLGVYLRMLNIAVPSTRGPSADELPAFLQRKQSA